MRYAPLLTVALLCLAAAPAAEPQSKPARTALDRYSAARAKIDADYQAKLQNLNRNLAADLTAAMKAATKAGDLDEANAIKAVLEHMVGKTQTFQIDAAKDWQPTITVKKGQKISIEADASWTAGPGTPKPFNADGVEWQGKRSFFLQARLGDSQPITVGRQADLIADRDGVLAFRMEDTVRDDNVGTATVSVTSR